MPFAVIAALLLAATPLAAQDGGDPKDTAMAAVESHAAELVDAATRIWEWAGSVVEKRTLR